MQLENLFWLKWRSFMINVSIETLILELLRLKNKRVVIEVNSHKGVVPILIKRFESQEKECYVYFGDYDCKRWQFGIKKNEIRKMSLLILVKLGLILE